MPFPPPDGRHVVTPAASVPNASAVLDFVQAAFDGRVVERYDAPDGSVVHAEVMVGDTVVMIANPMPGDAPRPALLSLYVKDAAAVDATYERAVKTGAKPVAAPADQFYGYRAGTVEDVGGNRWTVCTIIEDLTPEEINSRMAAMMSDS